MVVWLPFGWNRCSDRTFRLSSPFCTVPDPNNQCFDHGSREGAGEKSKSPEAILGVPTLMPCLLATLQAMEVVKIILKRGKILRNVMVHADLETGQLNEFRFG